MGRSLGQHEVLEAQDMCCDVLKLGKLVGKIANNPGLPQLARKNIAIPVISGIMMSELL